MIIRRDPKNNRSRLPRMIVRRTPETVGERRQPAIVRRPAGVHVDEAAGPALFRRLRPGRRTLVLGSVVAIVAGLGLMAFAALETPLLSVKEIEVQGTQNLPAELVATRAGLLGENMITADLAKAQDELLRLPLVASVELERSWPNTISVRVTERQAWGTWQQAGVAYTIDRAGVVIAVPLPGDGHPVIQSAEPTSLRPGDRVDYQAVDAVAELYEKLPQQVGVAVASVAFVPGKGVQVVTTTGQTALFGDSSAIAYKLAVWAALDQRARAEHINYSTIDLRYGNRPVLQ